jgi:KTSC domain
MPSTVISQFHYNADSRTLKVVFVSGIVYEYKNVPEEVCEAMKTSRSKGIYFNQHIKGKFKFEKVE